MFYSQENVKQKEIVIFKFEAAFVKKKKAKAKKKKPKGYKESKKRESRIKCRQNTNDRFHLSKVCYFSVN